MTKNNPTFVLTVANQKGGAGKTTSAVSIASALALRGFKTTLIDCDEQMHSGLALGVDGDNLPKGQFSILDAFLAKKPADKIEMHFPDRFGGNLWLVPGNKGMSGLHIRLDAELNAKMAAGDLSDLEVDERKDQNRRLLKASVDALRGKRDVVVIDTPPALGFPLTSSLIAADHYLIPVNGSAFDLDGLKRLLRTAKQIRGKFQPDLKLLGVLMSRVKTGTNIDEEVEAYLAKFFEKGDFFKTQIKDSVKHREATFRHLTIHEHAPKDHSAKQYMALTEEVLAKLGMPASPLPATEDPANDGAPNVLAAEAAKEG